MGGRCECARPAGRIAPPPPVGLREGGRTCGDEGVREDVVEKRALDDNEIFMISGPQCGARRHGASKPCPPCSFILAGSPAIGCLAPRRIAGRSAM